MPKRSFLFVTLLAGLVVGVVGTVAAYSLQRPTPGASTASTPIDRAALEQILATGGFDLMTTDVHDHSQQAAAVRVAPMGRSRPRWLIPGLIAVIIGAGLVLIGAIPFSTAVSAGLIGGMLLMHLGGHGGHGAHGGTTSAGETPVDEADKPARSGGCR